MVVSGQNVKGEKVQWENFLHPLQTASSARSTDIHNIKQALVIIIIIIIIPVTVFI